MARILCPVKSRSMRTTRRLPARMAFGMQPGCRGMSDIVAFTSLTLDGVMQAPGRPDEDPRGGFEYGGWATPYTDEVIGGMAGEGMGNTGGILLGRRTYEDFHGFWPHQTDNPFTEILNNTPKYVASNTLEEPLAWQNSTLLQGDAVDALPQLKRRLQKDLVLLGSGNLARSLIGHNLIDRYILLIHPLVLGSGQRLFEDDGATAKLRLVDSKTSTTGVIIAIYEPDAAPLG
jgi:dihydrofolate reductase